MASEYFLYDTTYDNTLVGRSDINFTPAPPYDQIFIDYFIPETQPLYFYRESGGTIIHNQQSTIDDYLNSTSPTPTPYDYIKQSTLDMARTTFETYTGTTAPEKFAPKESPILNNSVVVNGTLNLLLDNHAGSNDTYTATNPNITQLVGGLFIIFKPRTSNIGSCTLNINGMGAKNILNRDYSNVANNDVRANAYVPMIYDGTSWILMW